MAEGGHDGAWYCGHREQYDENGLRNFCPDEGCPKGFCARNAGWKFGDPSPDQCLGISLSTQPFVVVDENGAREYLDGRGL